MAAVVLPLALAAVLVAVTGSWLFAALTVLSPLLALSSWLGARRQTRRAGRAHDRRHRAALAEFESALLTARARHEAARDERVVDLGTVAERIRSGVRLWERRLDHIDALRLCVGQAEQRWSPCLAPAGPAPQAGSALPAGCEEAVTRIGAARSGPLELDLATARVVGVVGDPDAARRVARSLVLQVLAHHGPADVAVEAVVEPARRTDWAWLQWSPHAVEAPAVGQPGQPGQPGPASGPCRLLVVDDASVAGGRGATLRSALRGEAGPVLGIVVATAEDRLPASCSVVVAVDAAGVASVTDLRGGAVCPEPGGRLDNVRALGAAAEVAAALAADLARFEDPDRARGDAALPDRIGLAEVLAAAGDQTVQYGDAAAGLRSLSVPIGVAEHGPQQLDLVADGPHALVAGTTGAGKSELLRTWITALAVRYPPSALNLVLIDFKGGSAFDACAALPHTVAVVTDLDEALAERVLRSLQAELARRELLLRAAGVGDVADAPLGADGRPVAPRLVVAIDEFATLRAELPDFLDALVGVAQRGRSLGVHLILATQRPAGVVSEHIKANTNIRLALRVQDQADSRDVIDRPDAAWLDRRRPGRALLRLARDESVLVQTAYAGAVAVPRGPAAVRLDGPALRPWADLEAAAGCAGDVAHRYTGEDPGVAAADGALAETDLHRLVRCARRAATEAGLPAPAPPWQPPLPAHVPLDDVLAAAAHAVPSAGPSAVPPTVPSDGRASAAGIGAPDRSRWLDDVPFLILDDPDHQRRVIGGWRPTLGNLLCYGAAGSGTTTALVSLVCALAARTPAERTHVHVVGDAPALRALAALPHVGNVVGRAEDERLHRLLLLLEDELSRRRTERSEDTVAIVLVVDGLASLLSVEAAGGADLAERWSRVVIDGAALGVFTVATAGHAGAVRHAVAAGVAQRLVFRLADPLDARQLGAAPVGGPAGRVCAVPGGLFAQVATVAGGPGADAADVSAAVARRAARLPSVRTAPAVRALPEVVTFAELGPRDGSSPARDLLTIPIGLGGPRADTVGLRLHRGDGVLVAGPARSGRSTALASMLAALELTAGERLHAVVLAGERSPLRARAIGETALAEVLRTAPDPRRWAVLAVDDADTVLDDAGLLAGAQAAGWVVLAAGRNDGLRGAYGHWTRSVRSSRIGLLLRPEVDLDGDLLGIRLPRRAEAPLDRAGRGVLVQDGELAVVQVAVLTEARHCP
ncbi:MAG: FtsK/SpoIIIE domain-containing protein [Acidimicrobiales bacterium]